MGDKVSKSLLYNNYINVPKDQVSYIDTHYNQRQSENRAGYDL
jgi:hypothetical protein